MKDKPESDTLGRSGGRVARRIYDTVCVSAMLLNDFKMAAYARARVCLSRMGHSVYDDSLETVYYSIMYTGAS